MFITNIEIIIKENVETLIFLVSCLIGIIIYFSNANEELIASLQGMPINNAFLVDSNSLALFIILCCGIAFSIPIVFDVFIDLVSGYHKFTNKNNKNNNNSNNDNNNNKINEMTDYSDRMWMFLLVVIPNTL